MAEETEKTSIKQLIQGMTSNEIEILQGIVKSRLWKKVLNGVQKEEAPPAS